LKSFCVFKDLFFREIIS